MLSIFLSLIVLSDFCLLLTFRCDTVVAVVVKLYGRSYAKMCLMPYANNKGADQPAHPRSLISTFVVRCLDSMMPLVSISEISRL